MKIIVAITGASGAVYARLTLERLLAAGEVGQIALIYSDTARQVIEYEGESMPADPRITSTTTATSSHLRQAVRPHSTP